MTQYYTMEELKEKFPNVDLSGLDVNCPYVVSCKLDDKKVVFTIPLIRNKNRKIIVEEEEINE